jgi:hypothetical protein
VLAVTWKADKSTIAAAFLAVLAGWGRIAFAHDFVLGDALIALGIGKASQLPLVGLPDMWFCSDFTFPVTALIRNWDECP